MCSCLQLCSPLAWQIDHMIFIYLSLEELRNVSKLNRSILKGFLTWGCFPICCSFVWFLSSISVHLFLLKYEKHLRFSLGLNLTHFPTQIIYSYKKVFFVVEKSFYCALTNHICSVVQKWMVDMKRPLQNKYYSE